MSTDARPTLRCLANDVPNDWEAAVDQSQARRGSNCDVPLTELRHPIIRKAAEDFPAKTPDADLARESISGLTDPVWWKVRMGARWRGAVWEDPVTGQAWLCAAGYRRAGEKTDFYKQFMAEVQSKGADHYLPTGDDRARLKREERNAQLDAWSRRLQSEVRSATLEIWEPGGDAKAVIEHPTDPEHELARVTISIEREIMEGETLLDLVVSVECLDYSELALVQWAELVVLTAIDPREQQWRSLPVGGTPTYSQILEGEIQLGHVVERLRGSTDPGEVEPGAEAHYAHRSRLVAKIVEGVAVKALCGVFFVPRQDHESKDHCVACDAIMRALPE